MRDLYLINLPKTLDIRGGESIGRATRTAILEKQDFPIKTQVEVND